MKKLFLLIGLCLAGTAWLSAQNIVSGTVTDKKGNPIPGVKVEILGGTESTITELDGTFRLETGSPARKVKAYYAGMQPKAQKVKPDMLIKMSETSWWNEKPDKYRWFLGAQVAFPNSEQMEIMSYGLMLGRVKNIGWYVRGLWRPQKSTVGVYSENDEIITRWTTGKYEQDYWGATGGFIVRLGCPIHFYVGLGYSKCKVVWETANGDYLEYEPNSYDGLAIDCGFMLKMRRVFINLGTVLNNGDSYQDRVGNFGIGLYF